MAVTEKPSQQAVAVTSALSVGCRCASSRGCAEGFVLGVLVGVLLAVVELLLECLGFLLVGERQACQAILELKGVEEDTVLVVREGVVYLLVPYNTTTLGLQPSVLHSVPWHCSHLPICPPS
jgi:hypothetical protein